MREEPAPTDDERRASTMEDLTFTRRTALALMGSSGLGATATDSAGAKVGEGRVAERQPGNGSGDEPWYDWETDVDANGYALDDLGSVDVDRVYTAARDADVIVWKDEEGTWYADGRDGPVGKSDDVMVTAKMALDSLTDDRTWKEKVAIVSPAEVGPHAWGDGPWDGYKEIRVPSNTILDVPAPIRIGDAGEPLIRAVYANGASNIEFPNLNIKGNPRYAVWLQSVTDVRIGHANVEMDADQDPRGRLAVRIDDKGDDGRCTDVQVDSAYIVEAGAQAFETYGVDRLQVGQVLVNRTPGSGVLLNDTADATVGQVVGREVNPGGGYATFRVANGCSDVTCGRVVGRDGGRGVFGVSGCENVTIGEVNLVGMTSHGALIQDCQNFTIGGGVVKNTDAEGVRIDSRDAGGIPDDPRDFAATSGVTVTNLRVVDDRDDPGMPWGIRETGPDTTTSRIVDNDVRGSGTEGGIEVFSPNTMVRNNVGGGLAVGTATLRSGSNPAARVEGVSGNVTSALVLRSRAASDPGGPFAYDHRFEWDGEQWDLVFEWVVDPGSDLTVDYIVDQSQAEGFVPGSGGSGGGDSGDGGGGSGDGGGSGGDPPAVTAGVVDDFEDGNLDEYSGDIGGYTVDGSAPVASGSRSLKENGGGTIVSTDGLDRYPAEGTTFSARIGYTSSNPSMGIAFGAQSVSEFYFARVYRPGDGDPRLQLYSPTNGKVVGGTLDGALTAGELYEIVVDWGTGGQFTVTLNAPDGTELISRQATDDAGIVGGGVGTRDTGLLDDYRVTSGNR